VETKEVSNLARAWGSLTTYAERGSPKYERAALRWLERYLTEGSPRLQHFAEIAQELAQASPDTARESIGRARASIGTSGVVRRGPARHLPAAGNGRARLGAGWAQEWAQKRVPVSRRRTQKLRFQALSRLPGLDSNQQPSG
jgi:hypothetical protein